MNDKIERLAKDLKDIQNIPTDYLGTYFPYKFEGIAENLINKGYIHHSDAVDYVKKCNRCYGSNGIVSGEKDGKFIQVQCPICKGKGVVLKGEKS